MRKHDVRKWLHAILDLLPVILIPVFMIYSHRHTIDNYEVQYAQNEVVDFNQLNKNRNVTDTYANVQVTINDYTITLNGTSNDSSFIVLTNPNFTFNLIAGHKYAIKGINNGSLNTYCCVFYNGAYYNDQLFYDDQVFTALNDFTNSYFMFIIRDTNVTFNNLSFYTNIFDLTQMFGVGNEPTIQEFNSFFPNSYYEYTTSKTILLKDVNTITYNDNDIGSQFMYCLYNSVDKYFNLNNVFNFQNVYDWFILNIFGGNAPLIVPIVWNIILYEFIMDILFLTYAVFMFIIDFAEHFMDSCFTRSYRGGTRK